MADVAEADDGVVGADPASPVSEQVPVHLLDAPERPTPAQQHRGVRQMQVRPDPGPLRRAGHYRDVGVGRQVHQQLDEDVLQNGIHGSILARAEPRSRPLERRGGGRGRNGRRDIVPAGPVTAARQVSPSLPRSGTARSHDVYS